MKQMLLVGLTSLLIVVFLPILLLVPLEQNEKEGLVLVIDRPQQKKQPSIAVKLGTEKGIKTIDLEEYLVGVVLSEMPASFELEALKAQAVAARTFACKQIEDGKHDAYDLCSLSTCCQAWNEQNALYAKLGTSAERFWKKAEQAVHETAGEVLTYDGVWIDAVYFSCSGGTTEDAVAVWGTDVPYLQSVKSAGEELSDCYQSEVRIDHKQFVQIVKAANSAVFLEGDPTCWIEKTERTEGQGIEKMRIGGVWFSGTELRSMFGLRSTKFSVEIDQEDVVFHVLGYGHRVGLSQYGANAMAKAGKSYSEILQYYYSGVQIDKKNP